MIFSAIPADVLYKLFVHLDVIDLIRLQEVSVSLYSILQDRIVWSNAYRISSLPHSKGPFPWQSSSYLKRVIISQAKIKRNWPPRPEILDRIDTRDINFDKDDGILEGLQFLLGRWLVVVLVSDWTKVCCYDMCSDLASRKQQHVIYQVPKGAKIFHLTCADVTTFDGQFTFIAFVYHSVAGIANGAENEGTLKIYKMTVSASLEPAFELVLDKRYGPQLAHLQITARALLITSRTLPNDYAEKAWIMDIQSYRVYKLPPPEATPALARAERRPVELFIGTTHVFVVHGPTDSYRDYNYKGFMEAYPIDQLMQGELTGPSHRSSIPYSMYAPKRWSIRDLPDGRGSITLMANVGSFVVLVRLVLGPSTPFPHQAAQIHFDASILEGLDPGERNLRDSIGGDDEDRRVLADSVRRYLRG
ncbi:hypothetical protein BJ138DRAFT_1131470, partial [Hygrophoropsis aurantiaca]